MTTCSTHVLDVVLGEPAVGVRVTLDQVTEGVTDHDGRIRFDVALEPGDHVLTFDTGAWFAAAGRTTYFPQVLVAFTADAERPHHHVPLLLSPFSYSTYRGT